MKFYSALSREGYADATIRMYHNNLIMPALEFAVDNDLIRKNPAKGCLEGYEGIRRREALTRREQQVFLDFVKSNGRPFTVSLFNAALGRMVKRYNEIETEAARREKRELVLLPHISNHILWHTGCTRMAESGMDPKVLQTIMGHSDIAVTMRIYNHVDQERIEREIKKMEYAI